MGMYSFPFWYGDPQIGSGILCDFHPHFGSEIPVLVWGSPNRCGDPQTKMGCPPIDSKTMMATARRARTTMATTMKMATGDNDNNDGDGATGDGVTGNDDDDDCNEQR